MLKKLEAPEIQKPELQSAIGLSRRDELPVRSAPRFRGAGKSETIQKWGESRKLSEEDIRRTELARLRLPSDDEIRNIYEFARGNSMGLPETVQHFGLTCSPRGLHLCFMFLGFDTAPFLSGKRQEAMKKVQKALELGWGVCATKRKFHISKKILERLGKDALGIPQGMNVTWPQLTTIYNSRLAEKHGSSLRK